MPGNFGGFPHFAHQLGSLKIMCPTNNLICSSEQEQHYTISSFSRLIVFQMWSYFQILIWHHCFNLSIVSFHLSAFLWLVLVITIWFLWATATAGAAAAAGRTTTLIRWVAVICCWRPIRIRFITFITVITAAFNNSNIKLL